MTESTNIRTFLDASTAHAPSSEELESATTAHATMSGEFGAFFYVLDDVSLVKTRPD